MPQCQSHSRCKRSHAKAQCCRRGPPGVPGVPGQVGPAGPTGPAGVPPPLRAFAANGPFPLTLIPAGKTSTILYSQVAYEEPLTQPGAYDPTTGIYTVAIGGAYHVDAIVALLPNPPAAAGDLVQLFLVRNNQPPNNNEADGLYTVPFSLEPFGAQIANTLSVSLDLRLNAGDQLQVQVSNATRGLLQVSPSRFNAHYLGALSVITGPAA